MPEMHLRQPGFTYSTSGPFTKNKQKIQKFMQTGDLQNLYHIIFTLTLYLQKWIG